MIVGKWIQQTQHMMMVRSRGHTLGVLHGKGPGRGWTAMALETDVPVGGVLDSHAHELLGVFRTRREARARCEEYAATWLRARRRAARCKCGPIDAAGQTSRNVRP